MAIHEGAHEPSVRRKISLMVEILVSGILAR